MRTFLLNELPPRLTGLALIVAAGSCVSNDASSPTACASGNLGLTALKDQPKVNAVTGHIDAAMQDLMANVGAGSCSVAFVAANTVKTINGYGYPGNENSPTPANEDNLPTNWPAQTPYYVGSIAKTITAVAMLRMIEENSDIALDDTLGEHLADYDIPSGYSGITIRQLLSHTSGLATDPTSVDSEASLVAAFPNAGAHPGIHPRYAFESYKDGMPEALGFDQQFTARYSNIGYSLLGLIIDDRAAAGQPADASGYEKYVFESVALDDRKLSEPTMVSMCLGTSWRAPNITNLAPPRDPSGNISDVYQSNGWEGPTGGWTMTVGDVGRLMIAIEYDRRLSSQTRAQMLTAEGQDTSGQMTNETGDAFSEYGLGVAVKADGTNPYFAKGGDTDGYTSNFKYFTDDNVGAAIICNREGVSHVAIIDAIDAIVAPCLGGGFNRPAFCTATGGLAGGD